MVGSSMFQLLYKTLLISVISGSLSIMNMLAFAQDTASTATTQASATGYTRDSNGVFSKTENHNFQGTKAGEDNALHVITMLAIGVIGMKLLMYKKWTLDMTIVAAACAAYVVAEILNIMNLKNQIEDMSVQVIKRSDGKIDQTQIETLQKLKESYEAAKGSIKTRKLLQLAAAAAFIGAAAVAAFQRLSEEGKFANCEAGITTALTEVGTACTTPATAPECASCTTDLNLLNAEILKYKAEREKTSASMILALAIKPTFTTTMTNTSKPCVGTITSGIKAQFVTPACASYLGETEFNAAFGDPDAIKVNNIKLPLNVERMLFGGQSKKYFSYEQTTAPSEGFRKYFQNTIDLIFPKAEAGMMAMLGLGAGAAAAFLTTKMAIGKTIDTWMFTPGARIIAWGILAGAAFLGAKASQDEMDKIDAHIADIDKILKDLNNLQNGIKSNNVNEQQIKLAALQANQQAALKLNSNAAVKTDCLTSSGSNNCTPLASQMKAMPGFADLPDSFKTVATQAASLGDGLSGTNSLSGSALTAAGALANNKNSIGRLAASVKSKLNDMLAKNGSPKIDYDKEESKLLGQMKIQTAKALSGSGMSAGSFLASTGVSAIDNAKVAIAKIPSGKKSVNLGGDVPKAAEAKKEKDLDFNFKETQAEGAARGEAGAAAAAAKEKDLKYDIGENDINTNSGDSIFQVISNRYIKSGYPRLLEEIPLPVKK